MAPSLRPEDVDVIDEALEKLVEFLILARLRNAPQSTAPQLKASLRHPMEVP